MLDKLELDEVVDYMYNADFWYICPILFIPASLIWALLDTFCEKKKLDEVIANKRGWDKRVVMKWIHGITGIIGFVIALVLIILVSLLLKFDLLFWEPM